MSVKEPGASDLFVHGRRRLVLGLVLLGLVLLGLVLLGLWLLSGEPATSAIDAGAPVVDAALRADASRPAPDARVEPDSARRVPPPPKARRIAPQELRALQRRYGPTIRVCYDRVGRRAPALVAGRATVTVELADGGRVREVRVEAGGDRDLEGCLRRAVMGWRFPQALGAQEVRFPVLFR